MVWGGGFVAAGEEVLGDGGEGAPDLLGSGEGGLAGRELEDGPVAVGDELVGAVEGRGIGGDTQLGADTRGVDGHTVAPEPLEVILVEPAADEDPHVGQPGLVQELAGLVGERREVAAV
jgi:hypothetical protein